MATLKQVRRAVSLHLQPPLPGLAQLSPWLSFPIMGSRGKRRVEGSPEVPAFWGVPEWLVTLPWLRVLMELAWLGTREPAETGVALAVRPTYPLEASFLGGRRRVSVWCSSFLNGCTRDWFVFRLTWGADGEADTLWMRGGWWEKRTVVWLAAAAPKSLQYCRQTPEGEILSAWKRIWQPSHLQAQGRAYPPKVSEAPQNL